MPSLNRIGRVQSPAHGAFPAGSRGQPVAMATGEHGLDNVQPDDPAPAVPALEPRPLAAEPARCPSGGDTLLAAPAARRHGIGPAVVVRLGQPRLPNCFLEPIPVSDGRTLQNAPF